MTQRPALTRAQIVLLRLDGLAVLALGTGLFATTGLSWWAFAAFLLAPDLSALGYLAGKRLGAWSYNLGHAKPAPVALIAIGHLTGQPMALAAGAIWLAHIGMDHAVGYGYKRPEAFKPTHLSL